MLDAIDEGHAANEAETDDLYDDAGKESRFNASTGFAEKRERVPSALRSPESA